jgi:hypothetical protein
MGVFVEIVEFFVFPIFFFWVFHDYFWDFEPLWEAGCQNFGINFDWLVFESCFILMHTIFGGGRGARAKYKLLWSDEKPFAGVEGVYIGDLVWSCGD